MYEVVVGIHSNLSRIGFAYSYYDKNKIFYGQIDGSSIDHNVPTEVILDNNNNVIQFGVDCIRYLIRKGPNCCHYFKDIKMHIYENKSSIKSQNSGKELPLKIVIQRILEKIKEIAIKQISIYRPNLLRQTDKIKWVVTVPSIWKENQRNIMMESCINAGLINDKTDKSKFFVLEPEAASLCCSINKEINKKYFKKGEYYIVCDLEEQSGSIAPHLVGSNKYLNALNYFSIQFGSNEIDRCIFKDIILKLFGCQDFDTFCSKLKMSSDDNKDELHMDWSELERAIKDFKEVANFKKIEENEKYPIVCSLFQEIFNDDVKIDDLIEEYNNNIYDSNLSLSVRNKKKWIVEFPYKIIYYYMKIQANSICRIINDISSKENITKIIFIGNYCQNEIMLKLIKDNLNKIKIYLQPSNPSFAIMEGAVLFGIEPSTIDIKLSEKKKIYLLNLKLSNLKIN